jgi:hypothetical protein
MPGSGGRLPVVSRIARDACTIAVWLFVTEYKLHISDLPGRHVGGSSAVRT